MGCIWRYVVWIRLWGPRFLWFWATPLFFLFLPSSHVFLYDLIHAVNNTLWTSEATPQGHTEHPSCVRNALG